MRCSTSRLWVRSAPRRLCRLVANDEGKLLGLPFNRGLRDEDGNLYDVLCGTFFLCGVAEDNFVSLSPEQIERYTKQFAVPEVLVRINGKLAVLPVEPEL